MLEQFESMGPIEPDEVQSYFPDNIGKLFGVGSNISFFGLKYTGGYREKGTPVAKFRDYFFAVTYDTRFSHPGILDSCDMTASHDKWIWMEGHNFADLKKKDSGLIYQNPLLIVWLVSHLIKEGADYVFAELIRYADHKEFRGRGIATQVFESICEKCRADNLKYVYVDDRSTGWPSSSRLITKDCLPAEMLDEICATYYDKPRREVFNVPMTRNLIRVLDDKVHQRLYQQMREQIK